MGLFAKFKAGLQKTHSKLTHEIKRIVTRSPRLTAESLDDLEAALLAADLGLAMTQQILAAAKKAFESQGKAGLDFLEVAAREVEQSLASNDPELKKVPDGVTVISIVGVNGLLIVNSGYGMFGQAPGNVMLAFRPKAAKR